MHENKQTFEGCDTFQFYCMFQKKALKINAKGVVKLIPESVSYAKQLTINATMVTACMPFLEKICVLTQEKESLYWVLQ